MGIGSSLLRLRCDDANIERFECDEVIIGYLESTGTANRDKFDCEWLLSVSKF